RSPRMTDPTEIKGLERRATTTRTRLVDTIDALERRGARIVATVNDARRIFALVADGVVVLGAVSTLVALIRSSRRATLPSSRLERQRPAVLRHVTMFALFAGVAYVARRAAGPGPLPGASMRPPRLRAIS